MPTAPQLSARARLALLIGLAAAVVVLALVVDLPSVAETRARVQRAGALGPVLFVALYVGLALLPLPKNVLSVAAGAVFGLGPAFGLVLLAAVLGASVAFWLGRLLGRDAVERYTGNRVARVDALVVRHGLLGIVTLRLVPLVPYTALNYLAGLSALRWSHYLVGSTLGMVPGVTALVLLGAYGTEPRSWPFITGALLMVLLVALGGFAVRGRFGRTPALRRG